MSKLLPESVSFENADYLFRAQNVVAELKCLERDLIGDPNFEKKTTELLGKWMQKGLLPPLPRGTRVLLNTENIPKECADELIEEVRKPLARVIKKANRQIKEVKALCNVPQAKGLLLLVSDGNDALPPPLVTHLVSRIPHGEHSSIDGYVYFNINILINLNGSDRPVLVWAPAASDISDTNYTTFCRELGMAWTNFYYREIGVEVEPPITLGREIFQQLEFKRLYVCNTCNYTWEQLSPEPMGFCPRCKSVNCSLLDLVPNSLVVWDGGNGVENENEVKSGPEAFSAISIGAVEDAQSLQQLQRVFNSYAREANFCCSFLLLFLCGTEWMVLALFCGVYLSGWSLSTLDTVNRDLKSLR